MTASTNGYLPRKMKAVFWDGKPFHVSVKEVSTASIKQPEDAIVRVTTAAICGSDLHTYHGVLGSPNIPYSLGHEAVGVVVEVGSAVSVVKIGDRVIIPDVPSEGRIEPSPSLTPEIEIFGEGAELGNLGGCQAEFVRVPFADESLTTIPSSAIDDLDFVLLSDIFPTAWGGLDFTGFQAGDTVVVFGAGPVGLLTAYSAILRGANKVYSVDHVKARLDKAASIGAIPIDLTNGDPSEQILKLEPGGVERVADAVGEECVNTQLKPQENFIIQEAIKMTCVNGGIGIIGVYFKIGPNTPGQPRASTIPENVSINYALAWSKNLTIKGGVVSSRDYIPTLLALIKSGGAKPSFVFTTEIGIDEAPKGYERFDKHLEIKVAIRFPRKQGGAKTKHSTEKDSLSASRQQKRRRICGVDLDV